MFILQHNYSAPPSHMGARAPSVGSLHSSPGSVASAPPHHVYRQPQVCMSLKHQMS